LYNSVSGIPGDLIEAALIDGAFYFTILTRIVLRWCIPALPSFAISRLASSI
jgi:ABC-type glycerol-3-phosphate transport system permease component